MIPLRLGDHIPNYLANVFRLDQASPQLLHATPIHPLLRAPGQLFIRFGKKNNKVETVYLTNIGVLQTPGRMFVTFTPVPTNSFLRASLMPGIVRALSVMATHQ